MSRISTNTSRNKNQVGFTAHGSVPGNDDRLAGHFCDVRFCRAYLAVDAASRPVVDKGVIAVPKSVSGVKNVGLRKIHGDIGVRVSRRVVLKHQSRVVGMQSVFVFEDGGRNRTRRRGWESVLPVAFDARGLGKMFARVLMRQDTGSSLMDPLVTAGVVEMPVSVDQLFDGIRVDAREGFQRRSDVR